MEKSYGQPDRDCSVGVRGSGDCQLCAGATTIRFGVALHPYEQEIRFVLQDLPVPMLW